jgi:hypothetical protein
MIKDPKTDPIPAPDPATPTVAAPAPMNLAAESISRRATVVVRGRYSLSLQLLSLCLIKKKVKKRTLMTNGCAQAASGLAAASKNDCCRVMRVVARRSVFICRYIN